MSQCVPRWDLPENPNYIPSNSIAPDVPIRLDYEVAELTWENGQLAMHGLGPPRVPSKPTKYTGEKPRASGTLESIVSQAASKPPILDVATTDALALAPWFDQQRAAASATLTRDALVPSSNRSDVRTTHVIDPVPGPGGTCVVDCSTPVGSCIGPEWSSRDQSVSSSATFGRESQQVTHDTYDVDMGVGFSSTSMGSPEITSSAKQGTKATTADDHDSVHSRPPRESRDEGDKKKGKGNSSISTKRSRAAAIHNQSERKRRDKINQRMKTLQKLVPNSSKTDKASMLDEVIDYLKQLQAQVSMMSRMNMPLPTMMLPMAMQQQLQMLMMAPMGMGMGVMDVNSMSRPMPLVVPAPFMSMASWDSSGDRLQVSPMTDPLAMFLACQSQPMNMGAYSRMAAMYEPDAATPSFNNKS